MTKQQMSNLFSWLPPSSQPQPNSGHSMLFKLDELQLCAEVCLTLEDEDVKFEQELIDNSFYTIEAQTED